MKQEFELQEENSSTNPSVDQVEDNEDDSGATFETAYSRTSRVPLDRF